MTLLKSEQDFTLYKQCLDITDSYEYYHRYEPDRYPCMVESEFWADENEPYIYDHIFYYQQKVICGYCGHKTLVWPEIEE